VNVSASDWSENEGKPVCLGAATTDQSHAITKIKEKM